MIEKIRSFLKQCRRIMSIATKPDKEEYINYAKIIAIGVFLLGMMGFILYVIFYYLAL
ncbi:MAG: protein translocase SEC61 complex subunit gamma [Candidatus Aenigmarchaeota archaeon]|nr:protein translocase SEC61 complex subunit gamma [Candidatus Aenigmarchaeota archaeon]